MENNYLNNRIEALEIAMNTLTEIIADKDKELKDLNWRLMMKEGQFTSSQKVCSERQGTIEDLREDLRISRCHVDNREQQMKFTEKALDLFKEKARLARKDAEYWAAESAKYEINCNNCNL